MKTPSENAKILRVVARKADEGGCHQAAEHLRDCAFQLEVFSLVGLRVTATDPELMPHAIDLVNQGVTYDSIRTDDDLAKLDPQSAPRCETPSDFNLSRN